MNNPSTSRNIFIIIGIAIVLIISAGYVYRNKSTQPPVPDSSQASSTPVGVTASIPGFNSPTPQGNTIKIDSSAKKIPAPKLDRAIPENTTNQDSGYRAQTIDRLNKTIEALKKDQYSYQDWIYLGLYRQILVDYDGALEAWRHASLLAPNEEVAFLNLAHLYDLYIKDYAQAGTYYKEALGINPADVSAYRDMHDMYRYNYKQGTSAAEDILKKGIARNPDALALYATLARYYGETGRTAEAKTEFDLAIALAKKLDNSSAVTALEQEQSALK